MFERQYDGTKEITKMDVLKNYHDFEKDILSGFDSLIQEFRLKLTNPMEGCYLLEGEKCKIKFTFDRGDIFCSFLLPKDSQYEYGYDVHQVYRFLYPGKITVGNIQRVDFDPKVQLANLADFIENNMTNVLAGDFSWLIYFNKEINREHKLTLYLLDNIDRNSTIYKKFWKGDPSWQADMESYLKINNIIV